MINILDILKNVVFSRALFSAAELNIAELLEHSPKSASELARLVDADMTCLARLLDFLVLNNVFVKSASGLYRNNESSEQMSESHPQSIKSFVMHDDPSRWNCFGNLTYSIKTGKDAFSKIYGKPYFDFLKQNEGLSRTFDQAMAIISAQEDRAVAQKISFYGVVADIGGGVGQLLGQIRIEHSAVTRCVLFDLPEVVAKIENSSLFPVAGSFFDSFKIDADFYLLKRVLHDWDDGSSLIILKNIAKTMSDGASLIIVEGLLDRANDKKALAACDLALLTIFGGQERTFSQIESLVIDAGLKVVLVSEITDTMFAIHCQLA